ncbi:MAG TPA: hypothetical protein VFG50_01945 [Rhodothermales bacterium]|nr:hypothetical protein [Rhodothermales bacterium]
MFKTRAIPFLIALAFQGVLAISCLAQQASVTQSVTLVVERVTRVTVSGSPKPLTILHLDEHGGAVSVSDHSTSYSLYTNVDATRITASIDRPVPAGTTLSVSLDSGLGSSRGLVDISDATQAVNVVTSIHRGVELNRPITYRFSADPSVAQAFENESRTITLTIVE